ncbi:reverse transcriptase [Plakobranchus ocellatus]|uniref:Reverse transcriptase n=1 Tax=Plakobranchus ocellatus TaxID=259542 RepID=A0AAV3ZF41_9GAST|nr:reverse transcriptase [Plakobranchus ocellatus]
MNLDNNGKAFPYQLITAEYVRAQDLGIKTNNLISDTQAGFRKDRQTLDQIVVLENSVKAAKTNSRTVGAIFLDLEKTYDTMWMEGLLIKLKKLWIKGLMYNYIANFNQDGTFQVRVGSSLSAIKKQINGIPQGAVISPTLFNIAVNHIRTAITDRNTQISQFADDCAIWKPLHKRKKARNDGKCNKMIKILEQQATNLIKHLRSIGLKVNTTKTQVLFNTKDEITLTIDGKTEIVKKIQELKGKNNTKVELCWILAHCGIQGNEKADGEAKLGLYRKHTIQTRIGKTEIKSIINKKMKEEWQNMWHIETKGNFFRKLIPRVEPSKIKFTRQLEELNRLRMGTTRYTTR